MSGNGSQGGPQVPLWFIMGLISVLVVLIVIIVIVALKRDQLNANTIVPVLSTIITGIVGGVLLRSRQGPPS